MLASTRVSRRIARDKETIMTFEMGNIREMQSLCIELDFFIDAPRAQVFRALTGSIGAWWGAPYLRNPSRARTVVLETRLGGRLYEDWGEGEGAMWATITGFERNVSVDLRGAMGIRGPVEGRVHLELTDTPKGTQLHLAHHAMGLFTPRLEAVYTRGWTELFNRHLRAFVEKGERSGLEREWERVSVPMPTDRQIR